MFGIEADKLIGNTKNKNMKLIKLASLTLVTAGILGVYNAGAAIIGVTTNSTPLNVAITVVTNGPTKTSNSNATSVTYSHTVKKAKLTNKQLLTVFQNWASVAGISFDFAGAKIVVGWDQPWDGDVLVVDKTGTNVLFDASDGVSPGGESAVKFEEGEAYFEVDFDEESGAVSDKYMDTAPGSETFTRYDGSSYEFYDDYVFFPYTDLAGDGAGKIKFTQKWDKDDNFLNWSLSATGMFPLVGDQDVFDQEGSASASASIKTSGSGKGHNQYWYEVD